MRISCCCRRHEEAPNCLTYGRGGTGGHNSARTENIISHLSRPACGNSKGEAITEGETTRTESGLLRHYAASSHPYDNLMNNGFQTTRQIHFEHCDPAGLIFYPRYFQLAHQAVEEWFHDGLGISHANLVVNERIGIPTVHLDAGFHAASRLEEILTFTIQVQKIGKSSVTLKIEAHCQAELRCRITQVIVFTQLDAEPISSISIPEAIRTQLARFQ